MKIQLPVGKYVLAVSGGVDSMVLLDLLSNLPGVEIIVAHFNHGIRMDSAEDEKLVAAAAKKYGLPLEVGSAKLGTKASEESARRARYEFLKKVKTKHQAAALVTAHHQDDLIETAFINQLRGTGRRGLTAIADNRSIIRPLLNYPKTEILNYAKTHNLKWREDSTNQSHDYLRNYIRLNLIPKMSTKQRQAFLKILDRVSKQNIELERQLDQFAPSIKTGSKIDRAKFNTLPVELGNELLVYWLRQEGLQDFDKKTISRLNVALRTAKDKTEQPIKTDLIMKISRQTAGFERRPLR